MNKKGQALGIGIFISVFITVLVGLILFTTVAQDIGVSTSTVQANNVSYTAPANGSWVDVAGQELEGSMVIHNVTNSPSSHGGLVADGNFTVVERVSELTGVKTIGIQTTDPLYVGAILNVTYTYGPDGYIDSSGGRAMAGLIPLFFALLIAIVALTPTIQSKILESFGR